MGHLWSKERFAKAGLCLDMHIEEPGIFWEGHFEGRRRNPESTHGFERDREPLTERRNHLSSTSANTSFPDSRDATLVASPPAWFSFNCR